MKNVTTKKSVFSALVLAMTASLTSATAIAHDHNDKVEPKVIKNAMAQQQNEAKTKQFAVDQALAGKPNQANAELMVSALKAGNFQVIEYLMNAGLDINTPLIGDGTPLMLATKQGNHEHVAKLLELGALPDATSEGDGNPLIVAAQHNMTAIAKTLIDHGADVNAIVVGDETPLINASRFGHQDMVELLVNNGADVNLAVTVENGKIRSPLNQSATSSIRGYLEQHGAN
ncbi:ankyrin repeat domain-containing protein [Flocculibacter collagenilyticus]|uniref:ankyrin repeat domain-containing protein n=1 Tax=Flocculibacter collagenilyticus TaxID=2744479 RepID=UPI0018F5577A|nr:ankyrin repeat domain-containing protein [Flocculibacter collagenilyticus]